MNKRQFKEFDLNERMDIINLHGQYVEVRETTIKPTYMPSMDPLLKSGTLI